METNTQSAPSMTPNEIVGAIKTFGEYGPMYEVLGLAPRSERREGRDPRHPAARNSTILAHMLAILATASSSQGGVSSERTAFLSDVGR